MVTGQAAQREGAAQAIAWIGPDCVEAVSAVLNFHPDRGAKELVRIPEASVPPLIELLSTGDDAGRGEASGVLAKLGALSVDSLVLLLNDSRPETLYWAARTLGEIGAPAKAKALDRLKRLALVDDNVGKAVRVALDRIQPP